MKIKSVFILGLTGILLLSGCSNKNIEEKEVDNSNQEIVQNQEIKPEENPVKPEADVVKKEENKNEGIKEQKKNPYEGITIVIDPGHSSNAGSAKEPNAPGSQVMKAKDVSGATGQFSKVPEYKLTASIGNLLKEDLEKRGFNVIMTKSKVEESRSNIERAEIGNKANAALTIRIHGDSIESSGVQGASMLIPSKNSDYTKNIADKSKAYGEIILNNFVKKVPIKNRGLVVREDLTGFNWSKVPVVLIEMGFLSNEHDDLYLNNSANYSTITKAIGDGIEECFKK